MKTLARDKYRTRIVKKFIEKEFENDEFSKPYLADIKKNIYGAEKTKQSQGYSYQVRKGEKLVPLKKNKISLVLVNTATWKKVQKLIKIMKRSRAANDGKPMIGYNLKTRKPLTKLGKKGMWNREYAKDKIRQSRTKTKQKLISSATNIRKTLWYKGLTSLQKKRFRKYDPKSDFLVNYHRQLVLDYMDENMDGLGTDTADSRKIYVDLMNDPSKMNMTQTELQIAIKDRFVMYKPMRKNARSRKHSF